MARKYELYFVTGSGIGVFLPTLTLLHKLESIGVSESLLSWFQSYLSDRRQRVVLNGQTSDWAFVEAGVPQGSMLGPLLFLIYINNIVNGVNSAIRLFADDTSLYIIVGNPQIAANMINHDLDTIGNWARTWLVDFNPAKTISMTLTRKHHPGTHPPLSMNNTAIKEELCHTHLGGSNFLKVLYMESAYQ